MKSIFFVLLLLVSIFNYCNAEEIGRLTTENDKKIENNSSKKLLELQNRLDKTQKSVEETQKKTDDLNKLEKTVNELNDKLGIKK